LRIAINGQSHEVGGARGGVIPRDVNVNVDVNVDVDVDA
jgi:hypothetical protein